MCLESTELLPRKAKEDIIVGKKLWINRGKAVTFYQMYPINDLIMKTRFILFTIIKILFRRRICGRYVVEEGFIHSYDLDTCSSYYIDSFTQGTIVDGILYVKAIIPKGALYYKDYWKHTYASNKLILKPTKEQLKYFKNK